MSLNAFARARDANEPEIIEALEAVGCVVTRMAAKGVPDLLVGFRGKTKLLEVKRADKKIKLTDDQVKWFDAWKGEQPIIVQTIADALRAIGLHIKQPGLYTYCRTLPDYCNGSDGACHARGQHVIGTYPQGKP